MERDIAVFYALAGINVSSMVAKLAKIGLVRKYG